MTRNGLTRELLAEFLGTFVLILLGAGVVAQFVLSGGQNGSYLAINLTWGVGVTLAVYVAGGVSGAHLNPAVTVALAVRRGFPWGKVLPYVVAQIVGAFAASAVVFLTYHEAFDAFDGGGRVVLGPKGTAGIFATYPQPYLSLAGGLIDQIVGTAVLLLVICALTDSRNLAPTANLGPFFIGLLVVAIGAAFGFNAGYAINPARDLGPRLFTAVGGWGGEVFRSGNYWFWVPIVGPLIGGVLGAWLYDLLIGKHFPRNQPE
jgi:MIP family channel proteins